MAEPEVKKKSKPEVEPEEDEVEESSGVDENQPKKFNWELSIRKILVRTFLNFLLIILSFSFG